MSYLATSGVIDKIGEGITKAAGAITQYGQIKASIAAGGQAAAPPPDEGFNWTPVLLLGGIGVAAYLLLRKKK